MGLLGPTLGGSEKADVNYMAAIVIKSTSEPVEIRVQEQESLIKKKNGNTRDASHFWRNLKVDRFRPVEYILQSNLIRDGTSKHLISSALFF